VFNPHLFEQIDWDDEGDEGGNLAHCLEHGVDEQVVDGVLRVLSEQPVEVKMRLRTADFAVVGPDRDGQSMWTLLFDRSYKRGDWLRPITGWKAKSSEIARWEQVTGRQWRGTR
jgi:hypothetical protein